MTASTSRSPLLLITLLLALFSCTPGWVRDTDCEAFAARVAECTGSDPGDLGAYCEANADTIGLLTAMDCDALEGGAGKADGWAGWKEEGEECTLNAECAGDLVCRALFDPNAYDERLGNYSDAFPSLCAPRASHTTASRFERYCDGWGAADCEEGDVCVGGAEDQYPLLPRYLGTCEAGMYGQPCACPDDWELCEGEVGGCGPDLVCVRGWYDPEIPADGSVCMRACTLNAECMHGCDRYFASIQNLEDGERVDVVLGDFCF